MKEKKKRKVLRRLKRLRKEMASDTPPHDGQARLEALEGDLAYVSFYPKDRKYVGLFTVRGAEDARGGLRRVVDETDAQRAEDARRVVPRGGERNGSDSRASSPRDGFESRRRRRVRGDGERRDAQKAVLLRAHAFGAERVRHDRHGHVMCRS